MLAVEVNPLRLFDNLSRILLEFEILLTIAMFEIWTEAHPTLKRAGRVMYQACCSD